MNELLCIDIPLSEYLPEESLTNGFDTVSKSQQMSNHSLAAYLRAADVGLDASFNRILNRSPSFKARLNWEQLRRNEVKPNREPEGRPQHKDIVSWSTSQNFYGRMPATTVNESGKYRIRFEAAGVNVPESGAIWCSIKSGFCNARASTLYWIGSIEATSEPRVYVFETWITKDHQLQIRPRDKGLKRVSPRQVSQKAGTVEAMGTAGLAIKWIEIERIEPDVDEVRKSLIGDLELRTVPSSRSSELKDELNDELNDEYERVQSFEIVSAQPKLDLQNLVQSFAQRAFRRPVTQSELKPYLDFANARMKANDSLYEGLRAAYRSILCSSRFLYFEEAPGELDDYALANRLSHFLWGLAPDKELLLLADASQLSKPAILRQQTERLLKDPRSSTFIRGHFKT